MAPLRLHHRIPVVGRPFLQRNEARSQRDKALQERDEFRQERDKLLCERDQIQVPNALLPERQEIQRRDASLPRSQTLHFHIDDLSVGNVSGWTFDAENSNSVSIEVKCRDAVIISGKTGDSRPDVARAFPDHPAALYSGFNLSFLHDALDQYGSIKLPISVWVEGTKLAERTVLPNRLLRALKDDSPPLKRTAYVPSFLYRAARTLSNCPEPSVDEIVDATILLAQSSYDDPRFLSYLRFILSAWHHCRFVAKYFPNINGRATPLDRDYFCKQNSPEEMISIIHHMYVLKTDGVSGEFAEFGCFKGFSSAMLSWACSQLGIRMHIFDSFEGLPTSDSSGYQNGDFSGSLDEVRGNIERFGELGNVVFHKGYFSESLKNFSMPSLMTLWMDVDLESSAQDVMSIADNLDPAGAIFSHECIREQFENGKVTTVRGPDDVVGPIIDRFAALRLELNGAFMAGNTGAFWRLPSGIPVLPTAALRRILAHI